MPIFTGFAAWVRIGSKVDPFLPLLRDILQIFDFCIKN